MEKIRHFSGLVASKGEQLKQAKFLRKNFNSIFSEAVDKGVEEQKSYLWIKSSLLGPFEIRAGTFVNCSITSITF